MVIKTMIDLIASVFTQYSETLREAQLLEALNTFLQFLLGEKFFGQVFWSKNVDNLPAELVQDFRYHRGWYAK